MCGILGGVSPRIDAALLEKGLRAMVHRGPDDQGHLIDRGFFIGMRRLAIIDPAGGKQPMFSLDQNLAIVFNGAIYNYVELAAELRSRGAEFRTNSDTEVLLAAYSHFGMEMLSKLRGMFAFAILDRKRREIFAARDRYGKKPLYYFNKNGNLFFASEIKALRSILPDSGETLTLNHQAIYDYLSLSVVPQPSTIYKEIHSLAPGSYLRFQEDRLQTTSYWEPRIAHPTAEPNRSSHAATSSAAESLEQIRSLVKQSVHLRLRSDVPLGVLLSGGIDSSVVAYEASRELKDSLRTFTIGSGDEEFNEADVAASTAAAFGVQNTRLQMNVSPLQDLQHLAAQYDQPFADPSALPSIAICRVAREHVKVALTGDGGDEQFCGYRRYLAARFAPAGMDWKPEQQHAAQATRRSVSRRTLFGFGRRFLRGYHKDTASRYILWTTDLLLESEKREIWKGENVRPTEEWIQQQITGRHSALDQMREGDFSIALPSSYLVKMDIAGMAASLETRAPLLDHELGEFMLRFPSRQLLRRGRLKSMLRDAYADVLPRAVLSGKKRGFEIPMEKWLNGELKELTRDTLTHSSSKLHDFIDSHYLQKLLNRRVSMDHNWASLVYAMLILELWLRES